MPEQTQVKQVKSRRQKFDLHSASAESSCCAPSAEATTMHSDTFNLEYSDGKFLARSKKSGRVIAEAGTEEECLQIAKRAFRGANAIIKHFTKKR